MFYECFDETPTLCYLLKVDLCCDYMMVKVLFDIHFDYPNPTHLFPLNHPTLA